jgi:hypothetical protein
MHRVLSPIAADRHYKVGETIDGLTDAQIESLLSAGVIGELDDTKVIGSGVVLVGSPFVPAMFRMRNGKAVSQAQLLELALGTTELTADQWNHLPAETIEAHLQEAYFSLDASIQQSMQPPQQLDETKNSEAPSGAPSATPESASGTEAAPEKVLDPKADSSVAPSTAPKATTKTAAKRS